MRQLNGPSLEKRTRAPSIRQTPRTKHPPSGTTRCCRLAVSLEDQSPKRPQKPSIDATPPVSHDPGRQAVTCRAHRTANALRSSPFQRLKALSTPAAHKGRRRQSTSRPARPTSSRFGGFAGLTRRLTVGQKSPRDEWCGDGAARRHHPLSWIARTGRPGPGSSAGEKLDADEPRPQRQQYRGQGSGEYGSSAGEELCFENPGIRLSIWDARSSEPVSCAQSCSSSTVAKLCHGLDVGFKAPARASSARRGAHDWKDDLEDQDDSRKPVNRRRYFGV